jgi:rRNA-processing protein FCF1
MKNVLMNLYQQKLDLFKELGRLSASMAEFAPLQLAGDDAVGEEFFTLLDERTAVITRIDELTETMESLEEQGTDQEVGLLKRALQEEMLRVQEQNGRLESLVKGSLGQLRDEAKKLQSGKQSNRAYVGRVRSAEGAFIDKRR